MGLKYSDLYVKEGGNHDYLRTNLYRENTHVFSYYILTSIFMNQYIDFLLWCDNHNTSLFKFNKTDYNFKEFIKLIEDNYRLPMEKIINYLEKMIAYINKSNKSKSNNILNSTRMTIIEYN